MHTKGSFTWQAKNGTNPWKSGMAPIILVTKGLFTRQAEKGMEPLKSGTVPTIFVKKYPCCSAYMDPKQHEYFSTKLWVP